MTLTRPIACLLLLSAGLACAGEDPAMDALARFEEKLDWMRRIVMERTRADQAEIEAANLRNQTAAAEKVAQEAQEAAEKAKTEEETAQAERDAALAENARLVEENTDLRRRLESTAAELKAAEEDKADVSRALNEATGMLFPGSMKKIMDGFRDVAQVEELK
jgi:chromosome segregation ATPase